MSLLTIAESIGKVRDITGADVRSVGATLFVDTEVTEGGDVWSHIMTEVNPQDIRPYTLREGVTAIDL